MLLLLAACGDDPCPRGSMLDGLGGLVVTEAEHPTGWGSATCFDCHAAAALHRQGCTPDVDVDAVVAAVDAEGEASCVRCHGGNGVLP